MHLFLVQGDPKTVQTALQNMPKVQGYPKVALPASVIKVNIINRVLLVNDKNQDLWCKKDSEGFVHKKANDQCR